MSSKVFYVIITLIGVCIIALVALKFLFKKQGKISKEERVTKILYQLSYYAVSLVEAIYKDGNGKKKLDQATKIIRNKLPGALTNLVTDEMIHKYIENALANLQIVFKAKKNDSYNLLDKIITVGENTQNVKAVIDTARNLQNNSRGYIEGYGEIKTNFKDKTEATAGLKAGLKL